MGVTSGLPDKEKTNNPSLLSTSASQRPGPAYTTRFSISGKAKLILTFVCIGLTGYAALYRSTPRPVSTRRPVSGSLNNPAHLIEASHGAVATENKRCSDIGVETLKAGGNAVDAAISAALCVGVVNMFA
jgi:hypothetical protein